MAPESGFSLPLFLLLTPNYYGQMFNNPKDIPFAVGLVWATYYMVRLVPALPRPPLVLLAKLGVAIGMTMGVRIGGLLLFAIWVCSLRLMGVADHRRPSACFATRNCLDSVFAGPVAASCSLPIPLCWYFGPGGQTDPIENPLRALAFFSHQNFPFSTLFAGRFVPASTCRGHTSLPISPLHCPS